MVMLFTYTLATARDEVADFESQMGHVGFNDLNEKAQEALRVRLLEGRHLFAEVRSTIWKYDDLNADFQARIDAVVENDYSALIGEVL